jgi:hypothetical protein
MKKSVLVFVAIIMATMLACGISVNVGNNPAPTNAPVATKAPNGPSCPISGCTLPPTEPPAATEAPALVNCDKADLVIPAFSWTEWLPAENQVCADAVKIRPEPFEAPIFDVTSVVQLATDYDDTDVRTLKYGTPWLIYEYDLPAGVRPVFQATQSDIVTSISLCWQREERDGDLETLETQLLMRIQPHNGGSALITFILVNPEDVPAIGQMCP